MTGLASVGAMYFGYFRGYIDKDTLTELDRFILRLFSNLPKEEEHTNYRTKALKQFVLTLSDQQLVTGFAILIASFALRCSISVLNFEIASSLAWFSSVTHLATLAILRQYFHEHV